MIDQIQTATLRLHWQKDLQITNVTWIPTQLLVGFSALGLNFRRVAEKLRDDAEKETEGQQWRTHWSNVDLTARECMAIHRAWFVRVMFRGRNMGAITTAKAKSLISMVGAVGIEPTTSPV